MKDCSSTLWWGCCRKVKKRILKLKLGASINHYFKLRVTRKHRLPTETRFHDGLLWDRNWRETLARKAQHSVINRCKFSDSSPRQLRTCAAKQSTPAVERNSITFTIKKKKTLDKNHPKPIRIHTMTECLFVMPTKLKSRVAWQIFHWSGTVFFTTGSRRHQFLLRRLRWRHSWDTTK